VVEDSRGDGHDGGGLLLTVRDLARLGRLTLDGGRAGDRQVLPEDWLTRSTAPQVNVDDDRDYGYLWWIETLEHGGRAYPSHYMAGAGGNRVAVFPDLDLVVGVTSENFGRSDAHDLTRRLLVEHVLPSVA
jgi:CubicO group peptidase (beta-lactamase class C family)